MKVVYFGSDVFLTCFDYFLRYHEIIALYTYHHDEDYMTEEGIVRKAKAHGIPVHYESISAEEAEELFRSGECELFFVAEYDRLIPVPEGLSTFRGVNVHSSLLPEGRSYYPIEAAMDRELTRTGVTIHKLAPDLDSGTILDQRALDITPEMDSVDVYINLARLAREMTEKLAEDLEGAWVREAPPTVRQPYWKRPAPERLTLSHDMTRAEALERFRRFNSMTQVKLEGRLYYVRGLTTGTAKLPWKEWHLRDSIRLYALRDGHARLWIQAKTGEDRK